MKPFLLNDKELTPWYLQIFLCIIFVQSCWFLIVHRNLQGCRKFDTWTKCLDNQTRFIFTAHEKMIATSAHEKCTFQKKKNLGFHDKVRLSNQDLSDRQMIFLAGVEADNFKVWKGLTPVQISHRRMKFFSSGRT